MNVVKTCCKCGATKPLTEFYRNKAKVDGRSTYCAGCERVQTRLWQSTNPAKVAATRKRWGAKSFDYRRAYHRKWKYGLVADDYDDLLAAQDGRCAICLERKPLSVDHDHRSGKVRGLLCAKCNSAIGLVGEDPAVLGRAIAYLFRHRNSSAIEAEKTA